MSFLLISVVVRIIITKTKQLVTSFMLAFENEVGRAHSAYGGEERCVQGFGEET